jgi:hypothetical protein
MTNTELKTNIDNAITNKSTALSITPINVGEQIKSTVDYIDQEIAAIEITPGPTGPTGPQGVAGPVGPAGLEWQGAWVSGTSYVVDDAVGYNGASWFCINPTSGTTSPNLDPTNWALLAAQGSQGPQGIQGIQGVQGIPGTPGVSVEKTRGSLVGASYPNETVLTYDINVLQSGGSNAFKLPNTNTIGKEIIVDVISATAGIYGAVSGALAFETSANTSSSQCILAFNDLVKFTCIGSNLWLVEHLQRTTAASQTLQETVDLGNTVVNGPFKAGIFDSHNGYSAENTSTLDKTTLETTKITFTKNSSGLKTTNLFQAVTPLVNRAIYLPDANGTLAIEKVKVSQQINVTTGEPEINAIDYVRIFANSEYQSCKLTGPHTVGKEIYIKNTTAFNVVINGIVENINGNSNLILPPNTYWHLIKEDGGTNSITAFKLSLT